MQIPANAIGGYGMPDQIDHLQINGTAKPISEIFAAVREFTVEYYQREYAWTKTNVEELINDLLRSFLSGYEKGHPRKRVAAAVGFEMGDTRRFRGAPQFRN